MCCERTPRSSSVRPFSRSFVRSCRRATNSRVSTISGSTILHPSSTMLSGGYVPEYQRSRAIMESVRNAPFSFDPGFTGINRLSRFVQELTNPAFPSLGTIADRLSRSSSNRSYRRIGRSAPNTGLLTVTSLLTGPFDVPDPIGNSRREISSSLFSRTVGTVVPSSIKVFVVGPRTRISN